MITAPCCIGNYLNGFGVYNFTVMNDTYVSTSFMIIDVKLHRRERFFQQVSAIVKTVFVFKINFDVTLQYNVTTIDFVA